MLADELGIETARIAATGWGGDWGVVWRDGDRSCVTANLVGDDVGETEEMRQAFERWAEAHEGAQVVPTGAGGDEDQAVDTGLRGLAGEGGVDDVVEDETTVGVDRVDDLLGRAEAGDDDRDLVLDDLLEVGLDARVGPVHDEVHAVRSRLAAGAVRLCESLIDLGQPPVEVLCRAQVERGEGADDTGAAGADDEVHAGAEEHRRGDDGQTEASLELLRQSHGPILTPHLLRVAPTPSRISLRR